jgi:putative transposase
MLAFQKNLYESTGKIENAYELEKNITFLKDFYPWLKEVESTALMESVKNLGKSYDAFFKSVTGKRKGALINLPKFKSKKHPSKSFSILSNDRIKINGDFIKLPKIGEVKVVKDQLDRITGRILRVTISKDAVNNYYASILVEEDIIPRYNKTGKSIGLDVGIKTTISDNYGNSFNLPMGKLAMLDDKIVKLNQDLSRKQKGSKNFSDTRTKLARIYRKKSNIVNDFHHKFSNYIVKNYDVCCIETLDLKGMMSNHNFAKSLQDRAIYKLQTYIEYKMMWDNKDVVRVSKVFPSTQICNVCKYRNKQLTLSDREWDCPKCSTHHDRDTNAALNLYKIGEYFRLNNKILTSSQYIISGV